MPKFVIDESLSPFVADFLHELGFGAVSVRDIGLKGEDDRKIIAWAKKNKRVIVTCDQDFGEIYYLEQRGKIGVIVLRSRLQSSFSYKKILQFLKKELVLEDQSLQYSLIISSENRYRKYPSGDSKISS